MILDSGLLFWATLYIRGFLRLSEAAEYHRMITAQVRQGCALYAVAWTYGVRRVCKVLSGKYMRFYPRVRETNRLLESKWTTLHFYYENRAQGTAD